MNLLKLTTLCLAMMSYGISHNAWAESHNKRKKKENLERVVRNAKKMRECLQTKKRLMKRVSPPQLIHFDILEHMTREGIIDSKLKNSLTGTNKYYQETLNQLQSLPIIEVCPDKEKHREYVRKQNSLLAKIPKNVRIKNNYWETGYFNDDLNPQLTLNPTHTYISKMTAISIKHGEKVRALDFRGCLPGLSPEILSMLNSEFPRLQAIYFPERELLTYQKIHYLQDMKNLQKIDISGCWIGDSDEEEEVYGEEEKDKTKLISLKTLVEIHAKAAKDHEANAFPPGIFMDMVDLPHLKKLYLASHDRIYLDKLLLPEFFPQLENLGLSKMELNFEFLLKLVRSKPKLVDLDLTGSYFRISDDEDEKKEKQHFQNLLKICLEKRISLNFSDVTFDPMHNGWFENINLRPEYINLKIKLTNIRYAKF